ncbi:MAG TPA: PAS domain S-box protein [Patescibacteria group bacterium]|nr:PAS domain S-box protein [Patescibacteria group bacterium]
MTKVSQNTPHPDPSADREKPNVASGQPNQPDGTTQFPMKASDEILRLKAEAAEAASRGIIITDRQSRTIWANRAMRELTGYSPEEIVGQNPRLFQSGRQSVSFYKKLWETILAGEEWHDELINRRKDGSEYIEQLSIAPVRDANGEISHFIGVKQDVTSERRAQERMRLLAQAVENSAELIGMGDPEGRMTYVNPALLRALGCKEEEVVGKNLGVMFSRGNPAGLVEEIAKKSYESSGWSGECFLASRDGKDIPVQVSANQIRDDQDRVVGSLGIARDISERKKSEGKLRESEELFRQLAENIQEVFFVRMPNLGKLIYMSPAYEEIWGRPRAEIYEQPDAWRDSIYPEDRERVIQETRKTGQGEKMDFEYRIQRPDGSLRWIRTHTYPVYDKEGRFSRVVGLARDITERKTREEELREIHEKLNCALDEARNRALVSEKLTELIDLVQCCQTDEQAYKIAEDSLASIFDSCGGALCLTSPSRDTVEAVGLWGMDPGTERVFSPGDCWALRRGKIHVVRDASSPVRCAHVHPSVKGGYMCVPLIAQGETLGLLFLQCEARDGRFEGKSGEARAMGLARQAGIVGERVSLALANLKLREILRRQSVRDPLTGLFNRRYMEETLDRELSRAARMNEEVAVAMCDLDRFKEFNDTFGHEAGDLVLREVASILRLKIRQGDIACRFGGEEFILILPEATEAIRKEIEALALSYRGRTLGRITISIGLAMYPGDGATSEALVRASDRSLYRAKEEGRDRIVFLRPSS